MTMCLCIVTMSLYCDNMFPMLRQCLYNYCDNVYILWQYDKIWFSIQANSGTSQHLTLYACSCIQLSLILRSIHFSNGPGNETTSHCDKVIVIPSPQ